MVTIHLFSNSHGNYRVKWKPGSIRCEGECLKCSFIPFYLYKYQTLTVWRFNLLKNLTLIQSSPLNVFMQGQGIL